MHAGRVGDGSARACETSQTHPSGSSCKALLHSSMSDAPPRLTRCPIAQEIKAKEMEELARTLAELGIAAPAVQAAQEDDSAGAGADAAADEKKKKKKKDKKPKAAAEGTNGEVPPPSQANGTAKENEPMEEPEEDEGAEAIDPAEVGCEDMCHLVLIPAHHTDL